MKRYVLGLIAGGAIVLAGVPAVLVGGYFLLEPAEREPCDYGFVHLSEREALVTTAGSGYRQHVRRVRIDGEGQLVDVWSTDLPVGDPLDWTVVGEYLVGATESSGNLRGELIAFRVADGHEVGRTQVRFVDELGPRWDWLPLDDGTLVVRNGPQLALMKIGDGGFTDEWRVEVEDHSTIGVTPEHVLTGGEHVQAFRRADGREVTLPDALSGERFAVSARSEEIVVFADRGLRTYPIDGSAQRELAFRDQDFPGPAEGEQFLGRFCIHGERNGAWIVSYPTSSVRREVTVSNRSGNSTSSMTFDVTVFVHEIAAVETSGEVRWRLEAGEWMLACEESLERKYALASDRPLAAHHVFIAYQRGIAGFEEDGPGDAVRYLSVDLDAGSADWFGRPPESPVHVAVRGDATYLYGATFGSRGTRVARFENGQLTGAFVTRQILLEATAFGPDDVWLGDPFSPSWLHLHGPALAVAESRVVDPVETGMISEGHSIEPLLEDAFEETAELYDLPPTARAAP